MGTTTKKKRANPSLCNFLARLDACPPAKKWAIRRRVSEESWKACRRGDWMLWIAAKLGIDRKPIVTAACDCAERALKFVEAGEDRPRFAIETARAWVRGEATIEQVRSAADASDNAASAAYAACASSVAIAADAAAYAAYAADAAYVTDAADVAYAAACAADAAHAAAYADPAARSNELNRSATIVRRVIPWSVVAAALRKLK